MLIAAVASRAEAGHSVGARSLFVSLVAVPFLAGLLWASGAVPLAAALGSAAFFALVVTAAGFLVLRAAHAADMPAAAAWAVGIAASAIALCLLVLGLGLRADAAFATWSVLVTVLAIRFRSKLSDARVGVAELLGFLLCGAATLFWCRELAQVPLFLSRDGLMTTWTDQFYHGAVISQFGDPRAAGRQAIAMVDTPLPFYHYASYLLPAAFAWPLDLPGLTLATSLWIPLGFLTMCAGAYTLGSTLAGQRGGLAALAALTVLPDAATYGLHNGFFGFHWYVLAVPGASYAIGVSLLAIALLHRWANGRDPRLLWTSAGLLAGCALVRMHIFLLLLPAWLATAAMLAPAFRRRRLLVFGAAAAAFGVFLAVFYSAYPGASHALLEFLDIAHSQQVMLPYGSLYGALMADHGPAIAVPIGVLLVYPAFLGIFTVLYPLAVLLALRSRGLKPIDFVPPALLVGYLVMMIAAPVPANGDATELTQRPFVLVYAVVAVWTATALSGWLAEARGLRGAQVRLALLASAGLLGMAAIRCTDKDWRWTQTHPIAPGLPQAASFLRSHWRPGDVLAVDGLAIGWVTTDEALQLVALTGIPAYLTRPYIHIRAGGARRDTALERHAALAKVAEEHGLTGARARLRALGVQWYVTAAGAGPRWDAQRRHAAFVSGAVAVYDSR